MPSLFNRKNHSGGIGGGNNATTNRQQDHRYSQNEELTPVRRTAMSTTKSPDFDNQVEHLIAAEVRMISGCHSLETSADISNINSIDRGQQLPSPEGRAGGACTTALLSILYDSHKKKKENVNNSGDITFQQLLLELRRRLAQSGMSQIPQLTCSRPLELEETPFSLANTNYQQQQQQQPPHYGGGGGTRRALLVGINYYGQSGQLSGCINDVLNVKKFICNHQGFSEEHVLLLIDDGCHHNPTRENIIRALRQLVAQSRPGDSVYFHYSGHGGLLDPDYHWNRFKAGKPNKEHDETLYPVDHEKAGQIRDFSLFNHFVKPMAAGVTVTCVMDCCHSGSVLDLPYSYRPTKDGTIRVRQSMDSLTNLAYLYILAGGMLPDHGFESVAQHLQTITGETVDNLQGTGVEELSSDINGNINNFYNSNTDVVTDAIDDNTNLGEAVGDDGDFVGDGGVDYGGDRIDNTGDFDLQNTAVVTGENVAYGDGDDGGGFGDTFVGRDGIHDGNGGPNMEGIRDSFVTDDYGAEGDCGENDCGGCDGCDVIGLVYVALFDD